MENGAATELAQRCGLAAGVSLDPLGRPALDDAEGEAMQSTFADVSLVMGDTDQGAGTLFITNRLKPAPSLPAALSCALLIKLP